MARRRGRRALPALDRLLARGAPLVFRPSIGEKLSVSAIRRRAILVRHALADVPGNPGRARSWAAFARHWPSAPQRELFDSTAT